MKKVVEEIDTLQKEIPKIIAEEQIQRMKNKIEEIKKQGEYAIMIYGR